MNEPKPPESEEQFEIDPDSVVLERLIEEIRNDDMNVTRGYDRVHNRHNR